MEPSQVANANLDNQQLLIQNELLKVEVEAQKMCADRYRSLLEQYMSRFLKKKIWGGVCSLCFAL